MAEIAEMKKLIKTKHFRTDMPLSRDPAKPVTVFLKLEALSLVPHSRQSVCERVFGSRDPFRNESAL